MTTRDLIMQWRQGHFLSACTVGDLDLIPDADGENATAIVVSHDCDIMQPIDVEPSVEVIVGKRIDNADGNYTYGKNPRRLHFAGCAGTSQVWIDLNATNRRFVCKEKLADKTPSKELQIGGKSKDMLQFWLAARYRRSAFPDEFNRRLANTGVASQLRKVLKSEGKYILAVFFDVDEGKEQERQGKEDAYLLAIDLLYSTTDDPPTAEKSAERARKGTVSAFRKCCFDGKSNSWHDIELTSCEPIADEAMTYAMSLHLKRWTTDDIRILAKIT